MSRIFPVVLTVLAVVAWSTECEAQQLTASSVGFRPAVTDSASVRQPDTFMGPDKLKHFMMSAFIEAVTFSSLEAVGAHRTAAIGAATAVTLGVGVARELHDRKTKGLFSLGDLTWDTIGTAAALLLISRTQR